MNKNLLWSLVASLILTPVADLHAQARVRVADYNIKFLSVEKLDAHPQRKTRLKSVVEQLGAQIIGLQEIKDRAALEQIFPPADWSILIDDDSGDDQDVALVVRSPLKFKTRPDLDADDADFLFSGQTFQDLFPNRRDVLVGQVEIPGVAEPLFVMVIHAKSRLGGRAVTDPRREGAARALVQTLDRDYEDKRFIVLGDFNDNPDDRSLNILETGDVNAVGGGEEVDGPFLINPAEELVAQDKVSHGKSRSDIIAGTGRINLVTTGSRNKNNEHRGDDTHTGDILFDQILFPTTMAPFYVGSSFQIFDGAIAMEQTGAEIDSRASDHLPVFADFDFSGGPPVAGGAPPPPAADVRIVRLLPNPAGADADHETITLTNQSGSALDLTGWKLRDRAANEATLTGTVGAGASRTITLPRSLALNNTGDEVALIAADGIERQRVKYVREQVIEGQEIVF